ncbi:MAG: hypothetical protein ACTSPD_17830 [Promethearchaeota archaeon]
MPVSEKKIKLLKIMYFYTLIGAGSLGLIMLLAPTLVVNILNLPNYDPILFGVAASVYLAFGILAFFGLRDPLKYLTILFLQLLYKSIWFIGVIIPLLVLGQFPAYAILFVIIYATYIIGDLIAIPFPYLFSSEKE